MSIPVKLYGSEAVPAPASVYGCSVVNPVDSLCKLGDVVLVRKASGFTISLL